MAREIAVNTYGYIWTMPATKCVRHLASLGYRRFELMIHPPHLPLDGFTAADRAELRATLVDCGSAVTSVNMPSLDQNLASPFDRVRTSSIEMFHDVIDLVADVGAPWLVVVPGRMSPLSPPTVADRVKWMTEAMEELLPRAEARGVGLAIENVPFAAFPGIQELGDFVRRFQSPSIGICYDAANAHFIGESVSEGIAAYGDLIRVTHLSDTTRHVWRHDRLGLGDLPIADYAKALDSAGFDGPCTLEIIDPDPEAGILESHWAVAEVGMTDIPKRARQ